MAALSAFAKDNEIDWDDFCLFCDEQQISIDQRKAIWKQLGGHIDDGISSKISPRKFQDSFISSIGDINDRNDDNDSNIFQSQDDDQYDDKENDGDNESDDDENDDDDDDEHDSNELILEFEIADHQELNGNNTNNISLSNRPRSRRSKSDGYVLSPSFHAKSPYVKYCITNYCVFNYFLGVNMI